MNDGAEQLLALAAVRAADRPRYFAWVLRRYSEVEGLSPEALSRRLGIAPAALAGLALCFRPRAETFAADVGTLAARYGTDPGVLAGIVRQVEALDALPMGRAASAERGLLLAARERPQRGPTPPTAAADEPESSQSPPEQPAPEDEGEGGAL